MTADAPAVSLRAFQRPVGTAFLVHSGFAASAWALGLATDRMDYKDMAWAAGPVANAWYQAVGIPVLRYGLPVQTAIQGLTWRQSLLVCYWISEDRLQFTYLGFVARWYHGLGPTPLLPGVLHLDQARA
jgi:hypothetical protein